MESTQSAIGLDIKVEFNDLATKEIERVILEIRLAKQYAEEFRKSVSNLSEEMVRKFAEIGASIDQANRNTTQKFQEMLTSYHELSDAIEGLKIKTQDLIKPTLDSFNSMKQSLQSLPKNFDDASASALKAYESFQKGGGNIQQSLANLDSARDAFKEAKESTVETINGIKTSWENNDIKGALGKLGSGFSDVVALSTTGLNSVNGSINKAKSALGNFSDGYQKVKETWHSARDGYKNLTDAVGAGKETFQNAYQLLKSGSLIQGTWNSVMALAQGPLWGAVSATWSWTAALLANPLTWIVLGVLALIAVIVLLIVYWDEVKVAAKSCWDWIVSACMMAWNQMAAFAQPYMDLLVGFWSMLWAIAQSCWNSIWLVAVMVWDWIVVAAQGAIGWLTSLWDSLAVSAQSCWDWIVSACSGGWAQAVSIFDGVVGYISNLATVFTTSGAALWEAFTEGIRSKLTGTVEAVKAGLQWIRNLLPFSDAKEGPLSTLTLSGTRLMTTIAEGVEIGTPYLMGAVASGLGNLPISSATELEEEMLPTKGFTSIASKFTGRAMSLIDPVGDSQEARALSVDERPIIMSVYLDGEQISHVVQRHFDFSKLREGVANV